MMIMEEILELQRKLPELKCGSCKACCVKDTVLLDPMADDLTYFAWHLENKRPVLNRKPNGECVYLTPNGCSTHHNMPKLCQLFDCRIVVMMTPKKDKQDQVRRVPQMQAVYEAGAKRLRP